MRTTRPGACEKDLRGFFLKDGYSGVFVLRMDKGPTPRRCVHHDPLTVKGPKSKVRTKVEQDKRGQEEDMATSSRKAKK